MLRVVLDTNGLVASLGASSPYRDLWLGFHESKYTLCVSTEILLEYQDIIASKTSSRIADLVIELILNSENVEMVTPYYRWNLIQADHDDNKFVDCAIAANATFIVSDDRHFRPLQFVDFPQVSVLKIMEFIEVLRSSKE